MFASYAGLHQALGGSNTCIAPCLHRVLLGVLHTAWPTQLCSYSSVQEECNSTGLNLADMPRHIILLRHGETAGLESLQEDLQVPNHRIPLSAVGVREALSAGKAVQQLLANPPDHQQQPGDQSEPRTCSSSSQASTAPEGRLFLYTSPFLRCIQTAQHVARALRDDQLLGFQEEVQLREQDWGNFQEPGQQAKNYEQRLKYGRFFYRFPDGESAADVYDRMTMFQDHFVRDIASKRFAGNTSVMLVTHGLALRLFLMRWLHWSVDDFLQVHNPPTAQPMVLSRKDLQPCDSSSSSSGVPVGPESVKSCYALTADTLRQLRGVSVEMGAGRSCSSKQQLLDWRPYLKQVPPPPAMDPAHEAALHQLMEVGYGNVHN